MYIDFRIFPMFRSPPYKCQLDMNHSGAFFCYKSMDVAGMLICFNLNWFGYRKMMMRKAFWQMSFFLLFLALAFRPSRGLIGKKYFVRIVNNLENNQVLNFECKSGDDTIGPRTLPPLGEFEFKFHLFIQTYFECATWYSNRAAEFIAFKQGIEGCGGVHCIYSAQSVAVFRYNIATQQYAKAADWQIIT